MLGNLAFTSFVSVLTSTYILSIILPPNSEFYSLKQASLMILIVLVTQILSVVWFMVRKENNNKTMKNIVLSLIFVCLGVLQACEKTQPTALDASVDGSEVSTVSSDASSEQ